MLIVALVLALIGLVALVFAVVTSNELVAWVCIAASVLGVVLLIVDALRERQRRDAEGEPGEADDEEESRDENALVDYPEEGPDEGTVDESLQGDEPGESGESGEDSVVDDRTR